MIDTKGKKMGVHVNSWSVGKDICGHREQGANVSCHTLLPGAVFAVSSGLPPELLSPASAVTFWGIHSTQVGFPVSAVGFKKKPTVFLLSHLSFEVKKTQVFLPINGMDGMDYFFV